MAPPASAKTRRPGCHGSRSSRSPPVSACGSARRAATTPENPLANAQFTRFTDWEGTEEGAEISPDGKFVAFLADREGRFDLWLSQVGTGRFSNLTRDFPPLAGSGFIVRKLGFSGDGAAIWFNPEDGKPLLLMDLHRRHAAGVPWRGRQHPRLVSRRHPPRLRLQTESR